ncbi:MAG: NAD(P)-binding domain-containing protein, partial [Myxococcota bacterium]
MLSCAVIGAGPGGIVCTKELLEQGIEDVVCFEKRSEIGGTFAGSYDSLELTSSTTFSMFSDWWVGDDRRHHFWTQAEAVEYWTSYAEHFGVLDRVRRDSEVRAARPLPDGAWSLELASGELLRSQRVAVVAGNNSVPRFPEWAAQLRDVPYSHSFAYRNAKPFEGKRVLVVGGGESGSDVAYEISRSAARCWVSLRETTGWVVPRKRGDVAADVSTHRGLWGLPREHGARLSESLIRLERERRDPVFEVVADLNERVRSRRGIWGTFGTKTLALPWAVARHGCKLVGEVVGVEQGGR